MATGRKLFAGEFAWGVASSAYQIEGAYNQHGKGPSIWDDFTAKKGVIYNNQHGNAACDFYNNYHHDLTLMRSLNIRHHRFSISWSRIFPEGTGMVNKAGVDFYNSIIDFCLELEIEPWVTLYHWDLPLELEKRGGWTNRTIIDWFRDYVAFCIKTFGDRVKRWMVLNEPMAFTGAGYFLGIHAPGKRSVSAFLKSLHHALLCQAEGARTIRSINGGLKIGTTFSCSHIDPATDNEPDVLAATRIDAILNRTALEPLLGLGYPVNDVKIFQRIEQFMIDGDEEKLRFNMDFIGLQNYSREIVAHSYLTPFVQAKIIKASERNVERTIMNWEVYPPSIYHMLKRFSSYEQINEIIVTENGAAFEDVVEDGAVNDSQRTQYLRDYIEQVLRARAEGVPVNGYFVWTFTDNFEWAEGYHPRFGLVHVDFASQKRTVKASGQWYSRFLSKIKNHSLNESGLLAV